MPLTTVLHPGLCDRAATGHEGGGERAVPGEELLRGRGALHLGAVRGQDAASEILHERR